MDKNSILLITGRTINQGKGVSLGKEKDEYRTATNQVELSPADMLRLGIMDGDPVKLISKHGEIIVNCKTGNLSPGLAFIAFGPPCGYLIGAETQASGMPDSKGFEIEVEPVTE